MGYFRSWFCAGYSDHIKPHRGIKQIMRAQVEKRRPADLDLLAAVHCLDWMAEAVIFSCFDLDEHIGVAVLADDINFANFLSIVSGFNTKSFSLEIRSRDVFPSFTEADPFSGQTP